MSIGSDHIAVSAFLRPECVDLCSCINHMARSNKVQDVCREEETKDAVWSNVQNSTSVVI